MLDMRALHDQLAAMAADLSRQAAVDHGRLQAALDLLARATEHPEPLGERLAGYVSLSEAPWLVGRPREALGASAPLPARPDACSVIAADGSQIAPSHHEIALCYLINVGHILYTYGTGEAPIQESRPHLFHREADMRTPYGRRRQAVNEDLLATYRTLKEAEALVELAQEACSRGHPAVALTDGTLIQWMLEDKPDELAARVLERHLAVLDQLRAWRVPVAGYVSSSRSADVVNLLKLVACPKARLECETCAWNAPPCEEAHVPMTDRRLWEARLAPGERSPVFESGSRILARYGEHRIVFFYLHVGSEVARIEVPVWVADDPALLDRVHVLAHDQAQKGLGYPIALQEAHNQAVVGKEDRSRFFSLLAQQMGVAGVRVAVSSKQLKKRMGVV